MPRNAPEPRLARRAVLHRLVTEQQPRGRQRVAERRTRQRPRLPFAVQQHPEQRQQRASLSAVHRVGHQSQRFGFVAAEPRHELAAQLLAGLQRLVHLARQALLVRAPKQRQRRRAHQRGLRPIHQRDVELVHHQRLAGESRAIALVQLAGEPGWKLPGRVAPLPPSQHVHPHRQLRTREVAPQRIQSFVPGIDALFVDRLEREPRHPERLHVIALRGSRHRRRHQRRVRHVPRRDQLAPQPRLHDRGRVHDRSPSHGDARRRPAASGRSSTSAL